MLKCLNSPPGTSKKPFLESYAALAQEELEIRRIYMGKSHLARQSHSNGFLYKSLGEAAWPVQILHPSAAIWI